MTDPSVYDIHAPKLIELGYMPLPIGPGTKEPQSYVPSEKEYVGIINWPHPRFRPLTTPQPGAGIGVRLGKQADGTYVIGLDWDIEDAALAAMDVMPATVAKEGQRGYTAFYRSSKPILSRNFTINGATAMQVLSDGRQTVVPPSVHPDIARPYIWTSEWTLCNTPCRGLPALPADYLERIEGILRPLGWEPEPEKPAFAGDGNGQDGEDTSPFRDLNNRALNALPAWVPHLGLYGLHRGRGHQNYRSVASFRESSKGRPLEQREDNLSFTCKGIKDFGTGVGYTPINLVMVVLGLDRSAAFEWLSDKLEPEEPKGPTVDYDALTGKAKGADKEPHEGQGAGGSNGGNRAKRFRLIPFNEVCMDDEPSYMVDELIPKKGIVLLWGPRKSFKSFFTVGLALHIAKGWDFHKRPVEQGTVVYLAFEGGHGNSQRIEAHRRYYNIPDKERVPLLCMMGNASLIHDHALLISDIKADVAFHKYAKPDVIVIDTLNKSLVGSESLDRDMAAYIRAAYAVRDAFDCVVIIVHHCGWDDSRPRGHTSLPSAVDAELSIRRDETMAVVTVDNMREGPEGVEFVCQSVPVQLGVDRRGKERSSLVMVPAQAGLTHGSKQGERGPSEGQRLALTILSRCLNQHGQPLPDELDVKGILGVQIEEWREALVAAHAIGDHPTQWSRLKSSLQARNLIRIHEPWVWVPLP
jgi:AAA domain/Bifunctional DNA primase/polymerase, N-terminal